MYCRHCFRRRLVGLEEAGEKAADPKAAASYIRSHPEVSNVLLSGGDSFLLSNQTISEYLSLLADIPHLDFIRFGTRIPVTFPMRITDDPELLSILHSYSRKKQIYIITHFNHPREITEESKNAVRMLLDAGMIVRNQTVLLKGVNDVPAVLSDLFRKLTRIGVLPYYIFQCRPVTGIKSNFQVPLKEGSAIVEKARGMLNGQAKSFRFCMSHSTGKIEILGPSPEDGRMLFKYCQARDRADLGRIFFLDPEEGMTWLD